MSQVFREFVKKIGSGRLTGRDLTREEACQATVMILKQEATPAQIGAFLIAHRIKRPTPAELAGILDAFDQLARPLTIDPEQPPVVLSSPYDGQERLGIVTPLTALICSSLGQGVVLHGSTDMPPKLGLTSFNILEGLGVEVNRSASALSALYRATGLGWVYLPAHFPEAYALQALREELGKRPPLATAELIWNPVGVGLPILGYTHRETIGLAIETTKLRQGSQLVLIRGVQGSVNCTMFHPNLGCRWQAGWTAPEEFRWLAADFGLGDDDYAMGRDGLDLLRHRELTLATLKGEVTPLRRAAIFSSAFVLLQAGFAPTWEEALAEATRSLDQGLALAQLGRIG